MIAFIGEDIIYYKLSSVILLLFITIGMVVISQNRSLIHAYNYTSPIMHRIIKYQHRWDYTEFNLYDNKRALNYLNKHKDLSKERNFKRFKKTAKNKLFNESQRDYEKYSWTSILYFNIVFPSLSRQYNFTNYVTTVHSYSRQKEDDLRSIEKDKFYLLRYINIFNKDKYKYYIGLSNAFIFIYELIALFILSIAFIYSRYYEYNKMVKSHHYLMEYNDGSIHSFKVLESSIIICFKNIIDKYVFRLLPLLIAFMSGLLAVLSKQSSENIISTLNPYSIIIRYSIPCLSSIQFIRIVYNEYNSALLLKLLCVKLKQLWNLM